MYNRFKIKCFIIFIITLFVFRNSCKINDIEEESSTGTSIYAVFYENDNFEIKYSSFDSIKFKSTGIKVKYDLTSSIGSPKLYSNNESNLLLLATEKKLYFIDKSKKKIITELNVPDTDNPEPYMGYGIIDILPYKNSTRYCILINRSVYLINLYNHQIEKQIWNCADNYYNIYIHSSAINIENSKLYLELTYYHNIINQYLFELDLEGDTLKFIYEYPENNLAPKGSKYICCSKDYLIYYYVNKNLFIKLSRLSYEFIDSTYIDKRIIPYSYNLGNNQILVQEYETGSFYLFNCEDYNWSDYLKLESGNVIKTNYQKMRGGDIYANVVITTSEKSIIINLSKKELMFELINNNKIKELLISDD